MRHMLTGYGPAARQRRFIRRAMIQGTGCTPSAEQVKARAAAIDQLLAGRRGFTYTVLSTITGEIIGCVYIYPPPGQEPGRGSAGGWHAVVRSWVCADRAALDPVLYRAVRAWLERDWPFDSIEYAQRI
jgi:hypothetical protein